MDARARERVEFERLFGIEEIYPAARPSSEEEPEKRRAKVRRSRRRELDAIMAASRRERREKPLEAPRRIRARAVPGLFDAVEMSGVPRVSALKGTKEEKLAKLREFALSCERCGLHKTRTNVVFADGPAEAELVFVGEAPGADEDAQGVPFVGRAGKLLDKIVEAMKLKREEVYICNVLKCRPPNNRTPGPDEVAMCSPMMQEQLAVIRPKVIVALGAPAVRTLLETRVGITRLRGHFSEYRGIPVMPTFHPAYLLRRPWDKGLVWDDMKKVMRYLKTGRLPREG